MDDDDPRIKELQKQAWGLQSLGGKPGNKLPEAAKRKSYSVASDALQLCTNAVYMAEADFEERAAVFKEALDAERLELEAIDTKEKKKLEGKCFRAVPGGGGGGYVIGDVTVKGKSDKASVSSGPAEEDLDLRTTGGVQEGSCRALSAERVADCCAADPEKLHLSRAGLGDSDMEAMCEGLRRAGAKLTSLDLSHNCIADAGVQRLVTALAGRACPKLAELWLSGNRIGPLGEQMLKEGLGALRRGVVVHLEDPRPPGDSCGATNTASEQEEDVLQRGIEVPLGDPQAPADCHGSTTDTASAPSHQEEEASAPSQEGEQGSGSASKSASASLAMDLQGLD